VPSRRRGRGGGNATILATELQAKKQRIIRKKGEGAGGSSPLGGGKKVSILNRKGRSVPERAPRRGGDFCKTGISPPKRDEPPREG